MTLLQYLKKHFDARRTTDPVVSAGIQRSGELIAFLDFAENALQSRPPVSTFFLDGGIGLQLADGSRVSVGAAGIPVTEQRMQPSGAIPITGGDGSWGKLP